MARAIELSRRALSEPGLRPFGAVIVKDGVIVGEGVNQANAKPDPTSHGEIEAIRDACLRLGKPDLAGCTLYTSSEPCPMCTAAVYAARLDRVVYAASAEDNAALAAEAKKQLGPVPAALVRDEIATPIDARRMPTSQLLRDEALAVVGAFLRQSP